MAISESNQNHGPADSSILDEVQLQQLQQRARMQRISRRLDKIYRRLYTYPSSYIDDEYLIYSHVRPDILTLRHDGTYQADRHFFAPRSRAWVESHPPDTGDPLARDSVDTWRGFWHWYDEDPEEAERHGAASLLETYLAIEFEQVARMFGTLDILSGWSNGPITPTILNNDYMTPRVFAAAEIRKPFAARTSDMGDDWSRNDANNTPHVIAMLMHHLSPQPDLLRTELLVIVGIMRTRLEICEGHEVAPVMLITTFAEARARITQAYYADGELVVLQSEIYAFNSPEARAKNVPLFLGYMASEPVGETRFLSSLD
ncbi:hypothetical protein BJY00DRAFT_275774, partial [Aspergillus carlsbadensis]